jgi:hypothetical protein
MPARRSGLARPFDAGQWSNVEGSASQWGAEPDSFPAVSCLHPPFPPSILSRTARLCILTFHQEV